MPAFDTNALVALVDTQHPHHHEAKRRFDDALEVLLHPCIIAEFTTVVRRLAKNAGGDGNQAARKALEGLLAQPRVRVVNQMDHAGALSLYASEHTLSFVDAVVSEMRWGFDREEPVTFDPAIHASWQRRDAARRGPEKGPKGRSP